MRFAMRHGSHLMAVIVLVILVAAADSYLPHQNLHHHRCRWRRRCSLRARFPMMAYVRLWGFSGCQWTSASKAPHHRPLCAAGSGARSLLAHSQG